MSPWTLFALAMARVDSKPAVVSRPTVAPVLVSRAFKPAVVPWARMSDCESSSATVTPSWRAAFGQRGQHPVLEVPRCRERLPDGEVTSGRGDHRVGERATGVDPDQLHATTPSH